MDGDYSADGLLGAVLSCRACGHEEGVGPGARPARLPPGSGRRLRPGERRYSPPVSRPAVDHPFGVVTLVLAVTRRCPDAERAGPSRTRRRPAGPPWWRSATRVTERAGRERRRRPPGRLAAPAWARLPGVSEWARRGSSGPGGVKVPGAQRRHDDAASGPGPAPPSRPAGCPARPVAVVHRDPQGRLALGQQVVPQDLAVPPPDVHLGVGVVHLQPRWSRSPSTSSRVSPLQYGCARSATPPCSRMASTSHWAPPGRSGLLRLDVLPPCPGRRCGSRPARVDGARC